jgi:acyl phosphate:glycerol-3-phosphate acyltransferase
MNFWVLLAICVAGSFLLGSIPFGLLVGRLHGIDVRKIGSGNVGAMNVGRILGPEWFVLVFLLDLLKGLVPTLVGGWWLVTNGTATSPVTLMVARLLVGIAAVLGHNYSPLLNFRGGKGVSTSLGVALGVYPDLTIPAVLAFAVWAGGFGLTRISSIGSILGGLFFPVFYVAILLIRGGNLFDHWPFVAFAVLVAVLVVVRHKANIARILAGTEPRAGQENSAMK